MHRILTNLTAVNFAAIATTIVLGFVSYARGGLLLDDWNYPVHFFLGLFTAIATVGLHCLIFIYFLGTGRWVKEVARAYSIADDPLPKSTRELKRKAFPPALFAMLAPIATAAAGMAQFKSRGESWAALLHLGLATVTVVINVWAYRVESRTVRANVEIIDQMMIEVERIRAERGLPTSAEALERQRHG